MPSGGSYGHVSGGVAQVEIGWTPWGMQLWCLSHNTNVLHVNYEGNEHPMATTAKEVATKEA